METIVFIPLLLLILFSILLIISLNNFFRPQVFDNSNVSVSVIIAAKNEEKNIASLIECLSKQNINKEEYEVIFIDDNSDDNTFCIAQKFAVQHPNFKVYKAENKKFPAKKGALDYGISLAKNPYILITDADCLPEPEWIISYSKVFSAGYEFVFGPAPFVMNKSLISKVSCFENLRTMLLVFGAAQSGFPYSAAARSFGFKKSSFENIGGYSNTTETLSGDDDLLLREAVKNKMKIGTVNNKQAFVYSYPAETFNDYLRQKARHTKTSLYYIPSRQIMLGVWHLVNLFCLFSLILSVSNPLFLIPFICKIISDVIIVTLFERRFSYRFRFYEKIYLQIIYEVLIVVNFLNAAVRKDRW